MLYLLTAIKHSPKCFFLLHINLYSPKKGINDIDHRSTKLQNSIHRER